MALNTLITLIYTSRQGCNFIALADINVPSLRHILLTDAQSLLILNNVTYTVKTGKISFYGLSTKLIGD